MEKKEPKNKSSINQLRKNISINLICSTSTLLKETSSFL